jgi:Fe2+ or Zn2+ uptake regulation protein
LTETLKERFMREQGFEVIEAEVRLAGYCHECRKRLTGIEATSTGRSRERG